MYRDDDKPWMGDTQAHVVVEGGGGRNNEASEASELLLTGQRNPERRAGVMDRLLERNTHRSRDNLE